MIGRLRSLAAYLAFVAMALQAAWPLLAQAAPARVALVPVCTVDGVTHFHEVPVRGTAPAEERAAHSSSHCAFCPLGADRIAVSFDGIVLQCRTPSARPAPAVASGPFKPVFLSAARPRAPPFLPLAFFNDQLRRNNEQAIAVERRPVRAPAV